MSSLGGNVEDEHRAFRVGSEECASFTNTHSSINTSLPIRLEEFQIDQIIEILFWTGTAISTLIVIVGIIANSLVLYFASTKSLTGTLCHLNTVVKHLAASDLLYGVIAFPLVCVYWKMGKI